jgi:hypothetical protein
VFPLKLRAPHRLRLYPSLLADTTDTPIFPTLYAPLHSYPQRGSAHGNPNPHCLSRKAPPRHRLAQSFPWGWWSAEERKGQRQSKRYGHAYASTVNCTLTTALMALYRVVSQLKSAILMRVGVPGVSNVKRVKRVSKSSEMTVEYSEFLFQIETQLRR